MSNEYAQVTIRTTKEEHKKIKSMAKKADVTMNQFIVDTIFKDVDTKIDTESDTKDTKKDTNDTELIEVLKEQLEVLRQELDKKNEQIDKTQNSLQHEQQFSSQQTNKLETLQIGYEEEIPTFTQDKKQADDRGFFSRLFNL